MKGPRSGQSGGQTTAPHIIHTHAATDQAPPPRPGRPRQEKAGGHAAAMAEYKTYKNAGLLQEWRERWRHVLNLRHH